jgi:hypothetical protein
VSSKLIFYFINIRQSWHASQRSISLLASTDDTMLPLTFLWIRPLFIGRFFPLFLFFFLYLFFPTFSYSVVVILFNCGVDPYLNKYIKIEEKIKPHLHPSNIPSSQCSGKLFLGEETRPETDRDSYISPFHLTHRTWVAD